MLFQPQAGAADLCVECCGWAARLASLHAQSQDCCASSQIQAHSKKMVAASAYTQGLHEAALPVWHGGHLPVGILCVFEAAHPWSEPHLSPIMRCACQETMRSLHSTSGLLPPDVSYCYVVACMDFAPQPHMVCQPRPPARLMLDDLLGQQHDVRTRKHYRMAS